MPDSIADRLGGLGLIPVVVIEQAQRARQLGRTLLESGLPCAEITFRTEAGEEAIRCLSGEFGDLLLGAGTILNVSQAKRAVAAGAHFVVSPGFNPQVVDFCRERQIPVFPGVCTPTELEAALDKGLEIVKFFPAQAMGGVNFLKALSAPYPMVRFIPTGGILPGSLKDYLTFSRTLACGGSWMVQPEWISQGDFLRIHREVQEAVRIVSKARKDAY